MQIGRLGYGLAGGATILAGAGLVAGGTQAVKAADTHRAVYGDGYGGGMGAGLGGGGSYAYNGALEQGANLAGVGMLSAGSAALIAGGAGIAAAFLHKGLPTIKPLPPRGAGPV